MCNCTSEVWCFGPSRNDSRLVSIAGHFKISYPAMSARKTDRPFPIGKAGAHPALRIQRDTVDRQLNAWNRDAPCGRELASLDLGQGLRRHADLGGSDLLGLAV